MLDQINQMGHVSILSPAMKWCFKRRTTQILVFLFTGLLLQRAVKVLNVTTAYRPTLETVFGGRQQAHARRHVLLWTQMRSGSRLTMHLLTSTLFSVFTEEPLKGREQEGVNASVSFLKDISMCRFAQRPDFYRSWIYGKQNEDNEIRELCSEEATLCSNPAMMEALCQVASVNLIRVVAVDLSFATPLLQDPSLTGRVIHLVRDPRALLTSRSKGQGDFGTWVLAKGILRLEKNPALVCDRYRRDLTAARSHLRQFPQRYTLVRYEDLALHPQAEVRRLYAFMDLPYTPLVAHKVAHHTLGLVDEITSTHPFSTFKNSTATVFEWRGRLPFTEVERIQQVCGDVLQAYGYRLFTSRQDYENHESHIVMPLRDDSWGSHSSTHSLIH
ncbi:carbohydrate sulfotransferase 6-like [Panulirus ornatus]|uniref:carbohydrate sulfotransferase 6-like n=1 Tax=Panulirus ornatus TaxID=150431 RepID=UPI003A8BC346